MAQVAQAQQAQQQQAAKAQQNGKIKKKKKTFSMTKFLKRERQQEREVEGYILGGTLGVGGYAKVKVGIDKVTKKKVALKFMFPDQNGNMSDSKKKQLAREIALMQRVNDKNVIQLIKYKDDAYYPEGNGELTKCILIVLEYASRGELFDYLMFAPKTFSKKLVRTYSHQLLNGLKAMHSVGFAHRDLKPENLLIDHDFNLKIADFGFARSYLDDAGNEYKMTTTCGTKGYLSPELLRGEKYSKECDIFAAGIIIFTTYAKFPPFQNAVDSDWWWNKLRQGWNWRDARADIIAVNSIDDNKLSKNDKGKRIQGILQKYKIKREDIEGANYKMLLFWKAHERSMQFSKTFKDFVEGLLHPNPLKRLGYSPAKKAKNNNGNNNNDSDDAKLDGIDAILQHPWMQLDESTPQEMAKEMSSLFAATQKGRAKKIKEQVAALAKQNVRAGIKKPPRDPKINIYETNDNLDSVNYNRKEFENMGLNVEYLEESDVTDALWNFTVRKPFNVHDVNVALAKLQEAYRDVCDIMADSSENLVYLSFKDDNAQQKKANQQNEDEELVERDDVLIACKPLIINKAELENASQDDDVQPQFAWYFKRMEGSARRFNQQMEFLFNDPSLLEYIDVTAMEASKSSEEKNNDDDAKAEEDESKESENYGKFDKGANVTLDDLLAKFPDLKDLPANPLENLDVQFHVKPIQAQ